MNTTQPPSTEKALPKVWQSEILRGLVPVVMKIVDAQLADFSKRLSDALLASSEQSKDPKIANLSFNAGNTLKNNSYAFYHLASEYIAKALMREIDGLDHSFKFELAKSDGDFTLVSYEEMDNKVLISTTSRPFEQEIDEKLADLNIRIASVLNRDSLNNSQNPFRPAVFIASVHEAWCEFDPIEESRPLALPLFRPQVFLDLAPVMDALNAALIAKKILPGSVENLRIKKTSGHSDAAAKKAEEKAALADQLKRYFSPEAADAAPGQVGAPSSAALGFANYAANAASTSQIIGYLSQVQQNSGKSVAYDPNVVFLPQIKAQAPQGTFSRVDEGAIDLLTKIFDTVFLDQHIPTEVKQLIGFLQVPVLKAALLDKEFFFKEEHPARRLIDLLSTASMGWNQKKGQDDPLFKVMKHNVDRIQKEFEQEITIFSDVVSNLESYVKKEEDESAEALSAPITHALKKEKIVYATKCAKEEVTIRIGTGEVVPFVETFLEAKWVPVLTIAYSVKDEKPQALESAIKTMDDLIWSVKPKITMEERKELIAKLPSMLSMLNKWINVVKWSDEERLQFFAELAECHASIVRAPIELSPARQLEIAVDVAKKAAERRIAKRVDPQPEPPADESVQTVATLQRGMWFEFMRKGDVKQKVKLAWVSPLRTLYIFTTNDRQEAFSMSAEDLAQNFRDDRVQVVLVDGLVDRALTKALKDVAVNDSDIAPKAVA